VPPCGPASRRGALPSTGAARWRPQPSARACVRGTHTRRR
jgi:hypothetical protein